jgi:hypothetical protein
MVRLELHRLPEPQGKVILAPFKRRAADIQSNRRDECAETSALNRLARIIMTTTEITDAGSHAPVDAGRSGGTVAARRAETLPRHGIRRRIFEFFNSGAGSRVAMPIIDLHFRLWRLRYGNASFAEYYAGSIAGELRRGGTHKTLGSKRFLSGSVVSTPDSVDPAHFRSLGRNYFGAAVRHGLPPEHTCVDYCCGSLRVGQHLMAYLDRGRYWGLDLVGDFYEAGKALLPPGLLKAKRPSLAVIDAASLETIGKIEPDYVVSFAVMKHVPPGELASYLAKVTGMMPPGGRALVTFDEPSRSKRVGAKIWAYCASDIKRVLKAIDPAVALTIEALEPSNPDPLPRTSIIKLHRPGSRHAS